MVTKILILAVIFFLPMIPTFWAIIDVAQKPFQSFQIKVVWFAIVTLIPVLGALVYFLYGRKKYTISTDSLTDDSENNQTNEEKNT